MSTPSASRVAALALILSTLILVSPTAAASKKPGRKAPTPEPPMQVTIVRSAQDGCEPNCQEWIAAQGQIDAGTLAKFKKVLHQLGERKVPVLIHSGGGLADEALAIGHLLRSKGLDVGVARTALTPCAPDASGCRKKRGKTPLRGSVDRGFAICASSCTMILAAGKRRFVRAPAFVGVHRGEMILTKVMHTYKMTPYRAGDGSVQYKKRLISEKVVSQRHAETPEKIYGNYERYFVEMGIEKEIIQLMLATPNHSIHLMTGDELRSTRLATHKMSGEQLVRGSTAPDDGWSGAIPPFTPIAPMLGNRSRDCTLRGVNCSWNVKHLARSSGSSSGAPVAPMIAGSGLLPSAAQNCTRSGVGCSWRLTPGASADGPSPTSTPSR